jgi:biopolymer transport protein TolR
MAGDFTGGGGDGKRKAVDIDMNLVPFIDMMSVLVSFLLITAVWTNLAQINIKPGGVGHDAEQQPPPEPVVNLSVLVAQDGLWVGLTNGQPRHIDKQGDGSYDWGSLGEALQFYKHESGFFNDRDDIEVAAEDHVDYQSVIAAMDMAVQREFRGIRYVDPASLSVRFKQ